MTIRNVRIVLPFPKCKLPQVFLFFFLFLQVFLFLNCTDFKFQKKTGTNAYIAIAYFYTLLDITFSLKTVCGKIIDIPNLP